MKTDSILELQKLIGKTMYFIGCEQIRQFKVHDFRVANCAVFARSYMDNEHLFDELFPTEEEALLDLKSKIESDTKKRLDSIDDQIESLREDKPF